MKKFVYSAVALTMATGASYAADTGWASLDQEISGLSSSLSAQNAGGPKVGGWVITSLRMQDGATATAFDVPIDTDDDGIPDDEADVTLTGPDELGFDLNQVRLHVTGDVSNDYSYKIGFDLQDGDAELADAYIKWKLMDGVNGMMGRFLYPTLKSATMDENRLLFLSRTLIGQTLYDDDSRGRSEGVALSGAFEMLGYALAIQNGGDDTVDELAFTVNVSADVMGKGAGMVEGAYGAAEGTNLTVGGFYHDDGSIEDGDAFGVEAYFTMGALSAAVNFVSFGKGFGDNSPYDVTVSYLFTEMYEAAVRYENEDFADATKISVGVNRYSAGHNLKWTLQYATTDLGDLEPLFKIEDEITLGATLAF